MRRDPIGFRERFKAWKRGEDVYKDGRPIPAFEIGKDGFHVEYVDAGKVRVDPETGDVITKTGARGGLMLPEVTVRGKRANTKNSKPKYGDYLTVSNDATLVISRNPNIRSIKPINPHLAERANQGAKAHAAWEEEHPNLTTWGNVLGAVPFAVAAYPLAATAGSGIAALGDAAAATSASQAITAGLTPLTTAVSTSVAGAPLYTWVDAGLSSLFGAHGVQTAINEGGISPTTALDIAPLGRLVKPMWNAAKSTRNFIPTLESNMSGVRYAYDRNPELANIGTLEDYNDYLKTVFPESKVKDINYHMGPKGLQELKPSTGEVYNTNPDARGIYVTPDKSYAQKLRKYTTSRLENPSFFTYIKRNLTPGGWDKANEAFTDIYPVMIDTKNPLLTKGDWTWGIKDKKYQSLMDDYDAIVNSGPKWYQNAYSMPETIIPKTEQSLILGSDADVAGFRRFMSTPQTKEYVDSPKDITSDVGELIAEGSERSVYSSKTNPNIVYKIEDGNAALENINNIKIRSEITDDIIAPETTIGYYKHKNGKYYRVTQQDKYKSFDPDNYDVDLSPELNQKIINTLEKAGWKVEIVNGAAKTASKNGKVLRNLEHYNWGIDSKGNLKLVDQDVIENSKPLLITSENAASMTPEQWTAAQDAAIARGDMAEAQRLRDLHFKVNAPNTKVNVPLWTSSEEAFNSFDLSHFGETDSGFFGYGHYLTPMEKYAATYHPINRRFYVNMENPYIGSNDQYFNRIQYVKDKLANRKEKIMRNLRDGKLTNFSKKLGINENTPLEEAEHLVDKYIKDETVKWNNKYVKYADEFEGKDGVLSWRELQGVPNKQEGIYKEVVVPNGEQIKLADAVTYDNNGVRIPLGERDNFNINDIRYGLIPFGIGLTEYGLSNWNDVKFPIKRKIK